MIAIVESVAPAASLELHKMLACKKFVLLILVLAGHCLALKAPKNHHGHSGRNRLVSRYLPAMPMNFLGILQRRAPEGVQLKRFVGVAIMVKFPFFIAPATALALIGEVPPERNQFEGKIRSEQPANWVWPSPPKFDIYKGILGNKISEMIPLPGGSALAGSELVLYRLMHWVSWSKSWKVPDWTIIDWERDKQKVPTQDCYIYGWTGGFEHSTEVIFSRAKVNVHSAFCTGSRCNLSANGTGSICGPEDNGTPVFCGSKLSYITTDNSGCGTSFRAVKASHVMDIVEPLINIHPL